jgi:hypothetical protein
MKSRDHYDFVEILFSVEYDSSFNVNNKSNVARWVDGSTERIDNIQGNDVFEERPRLSIKMKENEYRPVSTNSFMRRRDVFELMFVPQRRNRQK